MEIQEVLRQHVKWLNGEDGRRANLEGANLRRASLMAADLRGAVLEGADLEGTILRDANLIDANLEGANLVGADLVNANLVNANLVGADLRGAYLRGADLEGAKLDDCYNNIPVDLLEVATVILEHQDRLDMGCWHTDGSWHNGRVHPINECKTAHCIAGWAHVLAAQRRPELLDDKVNVELVGRLALGEEAAAHFYDSNTEALEWLKEQVT